MRAWHQPPLEGLDAPAALPQCVSMTNTAPQAQTQYPPQRWHVEVRMHMDLESPDQTYVTAEIAKKVGLGTYHTWLNQERYDWLPDLAELPEPGTSFHTYVINRLDDMRRWLMEDLERSVKERKRIDIRPEMGVSLPQIPHQAG